MRNAGPILLLAPELYRAGGIQTYLRRLWEILSAYGEARDRPVRCLSLADGQEVPSLHVHPVQQENFFGCRRNKPLFVLKAVGHAMRNRDCLLVAGHLRFAPLALLLQRLGWTRSPILLLYGIEAWRPGGWLERAGARQACRLVSISRYTATEFSRANSVPLDRFQIIPPALPDERIDPPPSSNSNQNASELKVLTVGRLSKDDRAKGIDTLIQAVGKASFDGTRIHLTIVGEGGDLPYLRNLVRQFRLELQVRFAGAVPESRLRQLYQECDLFALPSRKEGFGIVFLEAMRFGKPIIGGNSGGIPEVIDPGQDGILVETGDADALARVFGTFSQNPIARRQMGLKGLEKVQSKYLFQHMAKEWYRLLDELP